jgi:hypothetical protein
MINNLTFEVINAADLSCERHEQVFVILRERPTLIADQTDPAIDMGRRRNGRRQQRLYGRMVHGELESAGITARIVAPHRPPLRNDRPEEAHDGVTAPDPMTTV